jgi:predicted transcriptional regulator with HTH domain
MLGLLDQAVFRSLKRVSYRHRIDYALLESKQPLAYVLEYSPAWRPIYTDKVAVLFERTPANAAAAPVKVQANKIEMR